MNFAATLECPVLFICRNNQYAISTPMKDQYRGDGIICRAEGYGMASVRVDGNDVLAVQHAVSEARKYAHGQSKPVLVELMTYRVGHHSTSDDSTAYRSIDEIEDWKKSNNPIRRFNIFLKDRNLWSDKEEQDLRETTRTDVLKAMMVAEEREKPEPLDNLFADVYDDLPLNLQNQQQELLDQMRKYPKHYTTEY